ncbi:Predicted dehydrogenase [Cnuella takakiae]|uniref:Predicted dehydrogenase n=1 Tax=Cnuella takakiae TaxID=1302690 RepID=A0A1M4VNR9_9BACT|nr:Gfo/Idh/MocA family oxidoreductase [Cnuella takakiae]OLY92542.1 oxidoreductase [Cnuella takakiae]SHE70609.1 Predicted dehydrogenase [Cnuella takakiae]
MRLPLLLCFCLFAGFFSLAQKTAPLRIGVAGLTHTHVHGIFNSAKRGEIEIVGIAESNKVLIKRYSEQYHIPADKFFPSLQALLEARKPEAVAAFNSIYEHLDVVQQCAPKGIHIMVEKPLAVSLDHARQMEALARKNKVLLLTNFETTWYASMEETFKMVHEHGAIGDIRRMVVHDGHQGPKEIGVDPEFLSWLTDPKFNGAGALMDFGCYGANLATWLLKGERPVSVTAIVQTIKPAIYPKVDDDATIVVQYPQRQVVIQASWNWPYSRKDLEVYGQTGSLLAPDKSTLIYRLDDGDPPTHRMLGNRKAPYDDPFAYFAALVRGKIQAPEYDLSSLETNMIVMEILEAAKQSAKEKRTISLEPGKL